MLEPDQNPYEQGVLVKDILDLVCTLDNPKPIVRGLVASCAGELFANWLA